MQSNGATLNSALFRIGEFVMYDANSMLTQIMWNSRYPIRHLQLLDHAGKTGFNLGRDRVYDFNFNKYEPIFREVGKYMAPDGDVTLLGCWIGTNHTLLKRVAAAVGKPVIAGTDEYYSWAHYQYGDYTTCPPDGPCHPTEDE